jgi:hypothetical protein
VSVGRYLSLAGGAGYSYEPSYQVAKQAMVAGRLRLPVSRGWAIGAAAGLSAGAYIQTESSASGVSEQRWLPAYRANGELSLEYRRASPLAFRGFVGSGVILNEPECFSTVGAAYTGPCDAPAIPPQNRGFGRTVTYGGLALVYQLWGRDRARSGLTPPGQRDPPAELASYGWQTLLPDLAALALAVAAAGDGLDPPHEYASGGAAAALYVTGGPVVHLTQHRPRSALFSLLARVALPVAAALVFNALDDGSADCNGLQCSFLKGAAPGGAGGVIADAAVLARR